MFRWSNASLLIAAVLLGPVTPLAAENTGGLYQVIVRVTGQGEENRTAGFVAAFKDVLVKVSGDPGLARDSRVVAVAARAPGFVAAFSYRDLMAGIPVHDEQGTRERPFELTVTFEPKEIDSLLGRLGRNPWTAHRPRLAVIVGVGTGTIEYGLTSDGRSGQDLREALAVEAHRAGLLVVLPSQADLGNLFPGPGARRSAESDRLLPAARKAGGEAVLIGSLSWSDQALGWETEWRFPWDGRLLSWRVSGVNFDTAFRVGLLGAAQIMSGNGTPTEPLTRPGTDN
jgi:hypothetical protein